jgi:hypothetical protein
LARVYYGSYKMTGTPNDKPVPYHERCQLMGGIPCRLGQERSTALLRIHDRPPIGCGENRSFRQFPHSLGDVK